MKKKTAATTKAKKAKKAERRQKPQRVTTDRRRDKARWEAEKEDRRKGFGRRQEDKAWDRIISKFD
ncbi:MAG: hypothetical protein BMS9Abin10_0968 [Gammaproteobacteria bacterium]|nr:MAG: hypothetical protein BMS9Abin10_0968 [Gammaproteobacteria bacterium]